MSSAPENPPVHPDDLLLFSLISAEFDRELPPSEFAELRKLEQRSPDRANALRKQCAQLREKLQQLPVISTEVQGDSTAARPWTLQPTSAPPRSEVSQRIPLPVPRRASNRRVIAVTTTLLVCVLCVILLQPNFPSQSQSDGTSAFTDARRGPSPASSPPSAGLLDAAAPAGSAFPMSVATASPSASADVPPPSNRELQPLLTESDWQVVVVRVRRGGPEDVLKELREVLARHGLTLAGSQPVTMPEWLGVFLPASIPHRKNLLDEVQRGLVVDAPEWDPTEIMRSSRDSILQAVRRSLESPTISELSGGEVFVAVSPAISGRGTALAKTQGSAPPQTSGAPAMVARAAGDPASANQPVPPAEPGLSALLLVFEFSPEAGGTGQRRVF